MHGPVKVKPQNQLEMVTLTPEMAADLLEHNTLNRPLNDQHVARIARQIVDGKWKFNGDTVKVADTGDVLDGQHRLWAIIEAKVPVETIVVRGIARDAFATIDTLRKPRSAADLLSLNGVTRHRPAIGAALAWLLRWQRGCMEEFRAPKNRIENSDIEAALAAHPGIARAIERVRNLRGLVNPSLIGFIYYVLANRNHALAERMIGTLENPAGVAVDDPFFKLRCYFTADHWQRKDALNSIALTIKAINAAHRGEKVKLLKWHSQGSNAEKFPALVP